MRNIDWIKNDLVEEINQNELMSKQHEKICTILNYVEHLLNCIEILISKSLIDLYISHNQFVLINKMLKDIWDERRN